MSRARRGGLALLCLALTPAAASAADYWAYQYKNIDVTVAGSSAYARNVARNADRLAQQQVVAGRIEGALWTRRQTTPGGHGGSVRDQFVLAAIHEQRAALEPWRGGQRRIHQVHQPPNRIDSRLMDRQRIG